MDTQLIEHVVDVAVHFFSFAEGRPPAKRPHQAPPSRSPAPPG